MATSQSCQSAYGPGTVYTYAQLEGLWINAGGAKAVAPIAAAIALAESGGCSAAYNPTDNNGTQTSWGLWQISNGTHAMPVANIMNPTINAEQAVAKYRGAGNSFTPWGTYDTGAYKRYLSPGATPDLQPPIPNASSIGQGLTATIGNDCAFGPSLPLVGQVCLMKKSTIRHGVGGLLVLAGGSVAGLGVILLAAFAFRVSGAAGAGARIASTLSPAGAAYRESGLSDTERAGLARQGQANARRQQQDARIRAAAQRRARQAEITRGNRQARTAAGTTRDQSRAVRGQAPRQPRPAPKPRPPREEHH